jgi:hypothetical protein
MALKKTVVFKGIEIKDAYIKVSRFEGDKSDLSFGVSYHASANDPSFNTKTFRLKDEEQNVQFVLEGDNPVKQAYEYLKTLTEFNDAVDC